jgi:predicted acetyltransferase
MMSGLSLERPALQASGRSVPTQSATLRLRWLHEGDEAEFVAAHRAATTDRFVFGLGYVEGMAWSVYLRGLADQQRGVDLGPGLVSATFLVAEHDGRLVGRVSIRHRLTDFLEREGGHIGYGVVPEFRNRGFATAMLEQALVIARLHGVDRSLLVCDDDNVASARVIERCGGELENVALGEDGVWMRRYWIS